MARTLPWKRSEAPGGAGGRGRLHDVRHDAGRLGATSTCSGEASNDGVARFLAAAVRCNSGEGLLADSLHDQGEKGSARRATTRGDEEARRGRRGLAKSPGNAEMRPRANGTPASYSSSLVASRT